MTTADDQAMLEQFLAQRDESCPACGYNLRALKGQTCPECGDLLRLRIGLDQPRRAAFITGLVALASSVGFSGLLLAYFMYVFGVSPMRIRGQAWTIFSVTAGEFVVSAILLTGWMLAGRRIRRCAPIVRWMLALACLAIPAISLVIFASTVK